MPAASPIESFRMQQLDDIEIERFLQDETEPVGTSPGDCRERRHTLGVALILIVFFVATGLVVLVTRPRSNSSRAVERDKALLPPPATASFTDKDDEIPDLSLYDALHGDRRNDDGLSTNATLQHYLKRNARECASLKGKLPLNSFEEKIMGANCGWGYSLENANDGPSDNWTVTFVYDNVEVDKFGGCWESNGTCPFSPKCKFNIVQNVQDVKGDVVVLHQKHASKQVNRLSESFKGIRVIFAREAVWPFPRPFTQKRLEFDFEMGVHFYAGITSPTFLGTPRQYLNGEGVSLCCVYICKAIILQLTLMPDYSILHPHARTVCSSARTSKFRN